MSIVISNKIRLVITDADVTNFNYASNKATEISILKDISIDRSTLAMKGKAERISTDSPRVPTTINT